jgi:hypothetical protein
MAMKKRFYTMNSQMMAYDEGGVTKDFLTDHLGSITAEIDQTQARTYDTRYSAYGRNNWSTGTGCGFGWVGTYGYRETGLFHMSHYVRARHYSYVTGNWSTVDPLWPREPSYDYVAGRAPAEIDLLGTSPGGELKQCINEWVALGYSAQSACKRCKAAQGYHGGYRCENLPNKGKAVPPWNGPPLPNPGVVICAITSDFPFGSLMDPGDAACEMMCNDSKPIGVHAGPQVKWCKDMCLKIRQGGCKKLEQYCDRVCGGGQKFACESCLAFYNQVGCPGQLVR